MRRAIRCMCAARTYYGDRVVLLKIKINIPRCVLPSTLSTRPDNTFAIAINDRLEVCTDTGNNNS